MQITVGQSATLSIATAGNDTPMASQVGWEYSPRDGSTITAEASDDGRTLTVTGIAPGTVNGTVTDITVAPALRVSFVIDVVEAGTSTVTLTERTH